MPSASCPSRGIFQARIVANRAVCLDHYSLVLTVPGFPPSRPGQFINVLCRSDRPVPGARSADWPEGRLPRLRQRELTGRQPLLRRPFSLAGRRQLPGEPAELRIVHRVVGVGTAALAEMPEGRALSVMGPLGNGYTIEPARARAAVVGGGTGIPPLLYLAEELRRSGKDVVAFAGARTARTLPLTVHDEEPPSTAGRPTGCTDEFTTLGVPTVVATDDGSLGVTGLVHEPFLRWLDDHADLSANLAVYACGPEDMLRTVACACRDRSIPCQVALERHMACGVGTCQGCVRKVRADSPGGWRYKFVCTDGPVFPAEELIW